MNKKYEQEQYTKEELIEMGYKKIPIDGNPLSSNQKIKSLLLSKKEIEEIIKNTPLIKKSGMQVHEIPKEYFNEDEISIINIALRKKNWDYFLRGSLFQRKNKAKGSFSTQYHFIDEELNEDIINLSEIEELLTIPQFPQKQPLKK